MTVRVTNAGPDADTIHVLPRAWYRNTWSYDPASGKPLLEASGAQRIVTEHPFLGPLEIVADAGPDGSEPATLFCDNETNADRLFGSVSTSAYPKDGIADHVVGGADTVAVGSGTKASFWYRAEIPAGETVSFRIRLRPQAKRPRNPWKDFAAVNTERQGEADEFYGELTPAGTSADEANVLRQAFAGMLWGKQLYYFDVASWLQGDPELPEPPASRQGGRNAGWKAFTSFDIMSMPDKWEYPWFAAWDLPFHCIPLARVDPAFAKYQLTLLCRERFQHSSGALPAYEWSFDDVNPPVQAWAALGVFAIDGARDADFLARVFDKLVVNFTWWVNRKDPDGSNLFEGGFLGLDNIGPIDRSHLPPGYTLEQSDATGWMGAYALAMAAMATILYARGRPATHLVHKFLEHFAQISDALGSHGLWDETDGFFYDRLRAPDGRATAVKVRSMVGIVPLLGVVDLDAHVIERAEAVDPRILELLLSRQRDVERLQEQGLLEEDADDRDLLLGVVEVDRVLRIFTRLFNDEAFLSPHGLRALSRFHVEHPFELHIEGLHASIAYEPAESTNRDVRGQLELARPDLVPGQLPRRRRAQPLCAVLRRPAHDRVPDGIGRAEDARGGQRRSPAAADLDLPRRARRPAAVQRRHRAVPDRPGLEGQHPLQRVLPRRQRRRDRRLPPDRMDRPRRRPDPAGARPGAADALRAHAPVRADAASSPKSPARNAVKAVAVYPGKPDSMHLREIPEPSVGEIPRRAGRVAYRVLRVGVDGTDREIDAAEYGEAPQGDDYLVTGHESFGRVVEVGPNVPSVIAPGSYVVASVRRPGSSIYGKIGLQDFTTDDIYFERGISRLHGFLTEYYVEDYEYVFALPPTLSEVGVLLEPISVAEKGVNHAHEIQRRLKVWEPRRACILGSGTLGLLTALVVRLRGLELTVYSLPEKPNRGAELIEQLGGNYFSTSEATLTEIGGALRAVRPDLRRDGVQPDRLGGRGDPRQRTACFVLASITGGDRKSRINSDRINQSFVLGNKVMVGTVNAAPNDFRSGADDLVKAGGGALPSAGLN